MKLQSLLATLNEGVNIDVFDSNTDKHLGRYDGKNSLSEVLNHVRVIKVDIVPINDINITVDFQPTKYLDSFDSDILYNEYYEWKKEVVGIEIQTLESNYGTLYIQDGHARKLYDFIMEIIYNDQDFINYVLDNLETFDEKRINS